MNIGRDSIIAVLGIAVVALPATATTVVWDVGETCTETYQAKSLSGGTDIPAFCAGLSGWSSSGEHPELDPMIELGWTTGDSGITLKAIRNRYSIGIPDLELVLVDVGDTVDENTFGGQTFSRRTYNPTNPGNFADLGNYQMESDYDIVLDGLYAHTVYLAYKSDWDGWKGENVGYGYIALEVTPGDMRLLYGETTFGPSPISFTVVPEPSSVALAIVGIAGILGRRHKSCFL